jgi:hypothetical protein
MRKVLPQIQVGVIASGGDPKSSSSRQSNSHDQNTAVLSPAEHGPDVEIDHLGYWPRIVDAGSKNIFNGVPDPGTIGYFIKNTGENGGILLGIANAIQGGGLDQGVTGGQSLVQGRVEELKKTDIGVSTPPKITESTERGAKVRKIQESGTMHSLSLLDGLPSHGALFNMAGFKLPSLPNVPTARQTNDQMMTQDMLQQLQGAVMSLGSMMQGLMNNGSGGQHGANSGGGLGNGQSYWQDIQDNLSPAMSSALTNLSTLIQSHETDNGVGYVTGGVVHYGTYLENAVGLLKNVQNLDDLMNVLSRLQFDTSLFGQDKLDNIVVQIENAWGTALQEVSSNGMITVTYDQANTQSNFAKSMSTGGSAATSAPPAGSQGGSGGSGAGQIQSMMGSLFGQSSGIMQDMWKRLAPSGEQTAKDMHQKLTQQQEAEQQKQINQATTDGGDPLSKNFYVTTGQ